MPLLVLTVWSGVCGVVYIVERFSVFVRSEERSWGAVQTDSLPLPSIVTHSHILRPH